MFVYCDKFIAMRSLYAIFLFLLTPLFSRAQQTDASTLLKIGATSPAFSFEIEKGKTANIQDYRGKIVLLNFFATWCPPCRAEFPRVQKEIWEQYAANPKFVLLAFDREEGPDKMLPFKESNKYTFTMVPDISRKVYGLFASQYIPRNVVLDENGKIIYQSIGYSPEEFDKLLALLKEKLK
jgi:peroxiredoxin